MHIYIYTDGSYSPQHNIGAWAAIIFVDDQQVTISGIETNTSHNRMELLAIIESINYLIANNISFKKITIVTDSQYAVNLPQRREKLLASALKTRSGNEVRNSDLVSILFNDISRYNLVFEKVAAHQRKTTTINYNREVDKIARASLRAEIVLRSNDPN